VPGPASNTEGCRRAVAIKMSEVMWDLGDVKFVLNSGDRVFSGGVVSKSDPEWKRRWSGVYANGLRSVPWYSVYGDSDLERDPCLCSDNSSVCALVNPNASDLDHFFMPDVSWYKEHPELGVEVIGMAPALQQLDRICGASLCPGSCVERWERRLLEASRLFRERRESSEAASLLVLSHAAEDRFHGEAEFLEAVGGEGPRRVVLAGGAAGGSSRAEVGASFAVGEIGEDGSVKMHEVSVDVVACADTGSINIESRDSS